MTKENQKKILIIAHDFAPFAGGGMMRIFKFVKYLPDFNFKPFVLTIKSKYYTSKDNSLLSELKENIKIFRTSTISFVYFYNLIHKIFFRKNKKVKEIAGVNKKSFIKKVLNNLQASVFIPDLKIMWFPFAYFKAKKIIKKYNIKIILTTSPPHSTQLIGYMLKKKYPDIKWIVDMRDLWTQYQVYDFPFKYVKTIEQKMEKKVFQKADKIVCATESLITNFNKIYYNEEKYVLITNGFDETDFIDLENGRKEDDVLKIVYTGSFNYWRNSKKFIDALRKILDKDLINNQKIKITFCGHITNYDYNLIQKNNLEDIIEVIPHLPHKESIKFLKSADLLLLIIADLEGKEVLTGKIFEYIGSSKPIFAIVPENGEAYNIINNNNLGYAVSFSDDYEIENKLIEIIELYKLKNLVLKKTDFKYNFSRKKLTQKLVKVL